MKLLLAPVLVTATKPLTPSHIKGLLWLDLLYKATATLHDVTYLSNRLSDDTTSQTISFWRYLDQKDSLSGIDYADKDDLFIAEQYLGFHKARFEASPEVVREYRERIERDHWIHGASRRLIEIWAGQYQMMGVRDPGLLSWHPFGMTESAVLDELRSFGCVLDATSMGGGVYLDFTGEGVPLRQLIDERGVSNYLVQTLRELLPLARQFDQIVLGFDATARHDFYLVEKVLALAGAKVSALSMSRVPLDGIVGSTRLGGWADCTCGKILLRYGASHDLPALRLGLRLYFVLHLGQEGRESFSFDQLGRCLDRAEGLLAKLLPMAHEEDAPTDALRDFLRPLVKRGEVCVSPNRLLRAVVESAPRSHAARTILARLVCA